MEPEPEPEDFSRESLEATLNEKLATVRFASLFGLLRSLSSRFWTQFWLILACS